MGHEESIAEFHSAVLNKQSSEEMCIHSAATAFVYNFEAHDSATSCIKRS